MRIGRYEVCSLETGRFALDGGAMFGVVPKALWEKQIPADARNRIPMALRTLLIREAGGDRTILVDTGIGKKWDAKRADIYAVDHSTADLESALGAKGLSPDDVTDVFLTHLHFDHAGGATKRLADGRVVPTFPRARYHVQRRNLELAQSPSEKDRASFLRENFEPLLEAGRLTIADGPGELAPGIEVIVTEGHTEGMQHPRVHGPEGSVFFCADMVPTAAHVAVPWIMAYDNLPLTVMEEKKRILGRAAAEGWILVLEHDPLSPAVKIAPAGDGFVVSERVTL
jgi:glyoxylase-like metal-dependent hydrolase (beta-lactamase superfamily II)